MVDETEMQIGF